MAKKSKKSKAKSKKRSNVVKFPVKKAKSGKKITLRERLDRIYSSKANLATTCAGRCECCKVACPQMNYSEFISLLTTIWSKASNDEKLDLICQSLEYFFLYDFDKFGKGSLVKPCMLLSEKGECKYYEQRPLNCRLYGLWPEEDYKKRVDAFAEAYEGKLTREELPLNTQCPDVKRVDDSVELTTELIQSMFDELDKLDSQILQFSDAQVKQRENYRTFHDWLLVKVLGEDWLSKLTVFMLAAEPEIIREQIKTCKQVFREQLRGSKLSAVGQGIEAEIKNIEADFEEEEGDAGTSEETGEGPEG